MALAPSLRVACLTAVGAGCAVVGAITSSLVSLALWIGLSLSGGAVNAAVVLGASLGVVAWLGLLFGGGVFLATRCRVNLSNAESTALAVCSVAGLLVGALYRKGLQLLKPEIMPPPEAYAFVAIPTAALALLLWLAVGRRMAASIRSSVKGH
jgi:hypothetical protein